MIMTSMSPSCSIDDWKAQIASLLGIHPNSFSLMMKGNVSVEHNTIRSYGINPETMVYMKYISCVCLKEDRLVWIQRSRGSLRESEGCDCNK